MSWLRKGRLSVLVQYEWRCLIHDQSLFHCTSICTALWGLLFLFQGVGHVKVLQVQRIQFRSVQSGHLFKLRLTGGIIYQFKHAPLLSHTLLALVQIQSLLKTVSNLGLTNAFLQLGVNCFNQLTFKLTHCLYRFILHTGLRENLEAIPGDRVHWTEWQFMHIHTLSFTH